MSGVEVVGAVFANASIALQLADAALKLYNFWKAVRDAPKSMRDLVQNLRVLEGVLKAIHTEEKMLPGPHEALPTYEPLLECRRYFDELRALAERLQIDISRGKMQRTWKSLKVVFEKSHIDEFKSNLESMKSTLILARQTLARLAKLMVLAGYPSLILISMLAAHNATFVANSVASITTQLSTQQAENVKAVRNLENMGSQLEKHIDVVGSALQKASNHTIPGPLMAALKSTIRSCARDTFEESFEKHYAELEKAQKEVPQTQRRNCHEDEEEWDNFEPSIPQRVSTAMSLLSMDGDNEIPDKEQSETVNDDIIEQYDHVTIRKRYDTIFGRLLIAVKETFAETVHGKEDDNASFMQNFQATLTFQPSPWLSRPALWRVSMTQSTPNSRHGLNINPTFSPIVCHKSPVFLACYQGNLRELEHLLVTRQATVHVIDEWGRGLMHVC